jgi:hypothetical protein
MKEICIFVQAKNHPYGIKEGSTIWADEIEVSSVDDGEFIYAKYSENHGTFGIVVGNIVESIDDIYELSECKVYRLIDEEVKRVAKGTTANLNPLAYPHYENV